MTDSKLLHQLKLSPCLYDIFGLKALLNVSCVHSSLSSSLSIGQSHNVKVINHDLDIVTLTLTLALFISGVFNEESRGVVSVDAEQSLYDAVAALRDNYIRRLLVVDSLTGNPLYVLTYKRILHFLQQSVSTAKDLYQLSVSFLFFAQCKCNTRFSVRPILFLCVLHLCKPSLT